MNRGVLGCIGVALLAVATPALGATLVQEFSVSSSGEGGADGAINYIDYALFDPSLGQLISARYDVTLAYDFGFTWDFTNEGAGFYYYVSGVNQHDVSFWLNDGAIVPLGFDQIGIGGAAYVGTKGADAAVGTAHRTATVLDPTSLAYITGPETRQIEAYTRFATHRECNIYVGTCVGNTEFVSKVKTTIQVTYTYEAAAVPEPVTWSFMILGKLATGLVARRRRPATS